MNLWQRWKKVSINNKLTIYMTAILAMATTFYTCMYRSSVRFAEQNAKVVSDQTDRLIAANEQTASATVEALNEAKRQNSEAIKTSQEFANAAKKQADAAKSSANSTASIVRQNERIVGAAERQANASQATAKAAEKTASLAEQTLSVSTQLIVGYVPKLARLAPNEPMVVDVVFFNKSNFVVSITGGANKIIFTRDISITTPSFAEVFKDSSPIPAFDLAPQADITALHLLSRKVSETEVYNIQTGDLYVFVFIRAMVKGLSSPLDSCYAYNAITKGFVICGQSHKQN